MPQPCNSQKRRPRVRLATTSWLQSARSLGSCVSPILGSTSVPGAAGRSGCPISSSASISGFLNKRSLNGSSVRGGIRLLPDKEPATFGPTQNPSWASHSGGRMIRRRFQRGSIHKRGTRKKVWVARYSEDVIGPDGVASRIRRSEVLGTVAEIPTRRQAEQLLSERLRLVNSSE